MLNKFHLDWSSSVPPEEQLVHQLNVFQELGLLNHSHQLPSARELAKQLKISPSVVENAYRSWQQEGLIYLLSPVVSQALGAGYSGEDIRSALDRMLDNHYSPE